MTNHQTIKPIGAYSKDIDWDVIYHTFHNPKDIAERIAFELNDHQAPVIFCGFPETAAYLATAAELQFVDKSSVVVQRTKDRYPDIHTVTEGDISSILKDTSTKNVVISCRISAFWQTEQALDEIATAILAHPRDQVIIDFFDREAVYEGMHIYYHTESENNETGDWDFKHFDNSGSTNPPFQIANIDISYLIENEEDLIENKEDLKNNVKSNENNIKKNNLRSKDINFTHETRRSFFTKMDILDWCTKVFPDYETSLATALLEGDPSFMVSLKRL